MTHKIRTTKQPWLEIEVDDADFLDLQRQGLLVEDAAPTEPAAQPAVKKTPALPASGATKEG